MITSSPIEVAVRQAPASWLTRAMVAMFAAGVPTDNLLVRYLGTASIIGAPLALAAGWQVLANGRVRRVPSSLAWLTAYAAWSVLSVFWARDLVEIEINVKTRLQLLALVWMCWQVLRSGRDIRAALLGYLGGCLILVVESWRVYRAGGVLEGYARYYAEGFNPNHVAVTLAFGIPMATYLALSGSSRAHLAMLYVPIALSGIALTASRSGMVTAAIVIAACLAWILGRSRAALGWALALVFVGVAAVTAWVPEDAWSRLFTVRGEIETGSVGDRGQIWLAGWTIFAEHPVVGVGIGGFRRMVAPLIGAEAVAHNTPLSVATETGLVGLLLLLAVPASQVWTVLRRSRNERAFVKALILAWFVGTAAATWEGHKQTWFVFLIAAAIGALAGEAPGRESTRPAKHRS